MSLVLLAAPLWVPLAVIIAVAVAASSGRPVFFTQERAGRNGRVFRFLKFRTMRDGDAPDAERLTRIGRMLRAASLDELPQLIHVLSGKMSLVGPRPLPARYLPRYSPAQARRHEVRPGMTGWAQVNGRNLLSWDEKFRHDVWYVDHRSFTLDLKILFLTALKVVRRDGIDASAAETMSEFTGSAQKPGAAAPAGR